MIRNYRIPNIKMNKISNLQAIDYTDLNYIDNDPILNSRLKEILSDPNCKSLLEQLRLELFKSEKLSGISQDADLILLAKFFVHSGNEKRILQETGLTLNEYNSFKIITCYFDAVNKVGANNSQSKAIIETFEKNIDDIERSETSVDLELIQIAIDNLFPIFEKGMNSVNSLLSDNFSLMCQFIKLFTYDEGSYLRPVLYELFTKEYDLAADDMGMVGGGINMYHNEMLDYFKTKRERIIYIKTLWAVCFLHVLLKMDEESCVKIIQKINADKKYKKYLS